MRIPLHRFAREYFNLSIWIWLGVLLIFLTDNSCSSFHFAFLFCSDFLTNRQVQPKMKRILKSQCRSQFIFIHLSHFQNRFHSNRFSLTTAQWQKALLREKIVMSRPKLWPMLPIVVQFFQWVESDMSATKQLSCE